MAEDMVVKPQMVNPCCATLKEKNSKLEASRSALRQGVKMQTEMIDKLQNEYQILMLAHKEEKAKADNERNEKEKQSILQVSLENEICSLKAEILALQENTTCKEAQDSNKEEVIFLQTRISEGLNEIKLLKEHLEKETSKAEYESKRAMEGKKEARETMKLVEAEKRRADEEKRLANAEREKARANLLLLEKMKVEANELRSKLISEEVKYRELKKKLEVENQMEMKENMCSLKTEISTCKEARDSNKDEVIFLQTRISEGLTEINLLKERLQKETCKAEYESKRAMEGKKEARETLKLVEAEKKRADEEKRLANAEREKARENLLLLEKLKIEANELRSKLVSEGVKYGEFKKKLEVEKQKVVKEKKRADMATAKAEEHRKLTEINQNKVTEVNSQANQLNQQLEEHKRRMDKLEKERNELLSFKRKVGVSAKQSCKCMTAETTKRNVGLQVSMGEIENVSNKLLKKDRHENHGEKVHKDMSSKKSEERTMVADTNFKKPKEKKHHADKLSLQLKDYMQMVERLMKEVKLVASMKSVEASSFPSERNVTREDAEMKFLKKKLKFEKMQVKHFKHASKLETLRNNILQQEICCLKQDLVSFTGRLNVLNNCFTSTEGTHNLEKTCSRALDMPKFFRKESSHLNSQNTHDHLKGNTVGCMQLLKHSLESSQPMVPMDEGILTESITGITSQLESLPRGCNKSMQSAVNSSTGSFSNRQFVGSQERVSPSARTSLKLTESNPEANMNSLSGQDTRIENNKQLAVVEKLDVVGKGHEHKKRKRVHDGFDSIGYNQPHNNQWQMQIEQKLSMLHDILSQIKSPLDETLSVPGLVCKPNSNTKAHKKRKVCIGREEHPKKLLVSNDNENIHDGLNNSIKKCSESMGKFEDVSENNYMRVLDLDNYADEEYYRRAIEEPLSPIKTSFLLSGRGTDECVGGEISREGCSVGNERSISDCTFHIDSTMVDSCKFSKDTLCVPVGIKMPDSHSLSDKDAIISFHRTESPHCKLLPKYCIIFSNIDDSGSISRILHAIGSCMAMCEKADLTGLTLQKILLSFLKTEDLSHKEKSCVLLSLELHIFSGFALGKLENLNEHLMLLFHSIAEQMQSVISDAVTRNSFVELCLFGELLILIEEFLLDWRVMELHDELLLDGVNPLSCSPSINVVLNGAERILKYRKASSNEFMAGGILLASICVATNNIGFMCMTSYNMLRVSKIDSSLRLTILHVFACICGPKYFKFQHYHLLTILIKSLVTFHEKTSLSATKCPLNGCEVSPGFSSTKCPFSDDAISVESVNSLLLEELQKFGLSDALHQNLLELVALEYMDKGGSKSFSRNLIPSISESDDATLCRFTDVLSLLELMSFHMSWEWTCKNTISRLLEVLDLSVEKNFSIVIIVLLGKLGRFGIDACGSEHTSIATIRNRLSNFLGQPKIGFHIQISAFNSLLGLLCIPYEELMNNDLQSPAISLGKIGNVDCLRKWYSDLSNEQLSLVTDLNCAGR